MDYKQICFKTIELTQKVADFLKLEQDNLKESQVETKSLNSLVSYVDKSAEKMLVEGLSELLPDAGYIAEEGTSSKVGDIYNWIIDPLDGTTNYIHGLPTYAVSIALKENEEIVIGVVLEVGNDECFYSFKGGDAYLNGAKIQVKQNEKLSDSLIATGFPYYDFTRNKAFFKTLKDLTKKTRGIRRLGTAATDLAYVACGRFDAFYEHALSPWDVAAGAFIVRQAGGIVSDYKAGEDWLFGGEIIASSSGLYEEFYSVIRKRFGE